jgi:hypothetical protein
LNFLVCYPGKIRKGFYYGVGYGFFFGAIVFGDFGVGVEMDVAEVAVFVEFIVCSGFTPGGFT